MPAGDLTGSSAALENNRCVRRMACGDPMAFEELDREERDFRERGYVCGNDTQMLNVGPVHVVVFRLITENPERQRFKICRFDSYDLLPESTPYFSNCFVVLKFQSCYFRR